MKVTIDGAEIEVAQGTTILEAALSRGKEIPHYCYHPGLSVAGNCRMCLVEVEGAPKLQIGCYTPVSDGMVVHTESEEVKKAREGMMEFFLINHPLDCPICDQAGECRLQEYAVEHGTGVSRFDHAKLALAKAVDIGEHVMLDQERCIQCSRCIRFCDEITGTSELTFFQRGNRAQIGVHPGKRLDNAYSGNVVDLCPVGALTLKEFRFESRVWYLKNTATVCGGCSRGCNVMVGTSAHDHYQIGDIRRVVPRPNLAVNNYWICDEGRLSYERIRAAERLATAESPAGTSVAWDEAVGSAARGLREAAEAGRAGAIVTPRLTTESMYAWKRLFDAVGGVRTAIRQVHRGEDDDLLIRADKGANANGAAAVFGADAPTEDALVTAIKNDEIDVLVVFGDVLDPADTPSIPEEHRSRIRQVVFVGPLVSGAAAQADVRLPAAAWAEEDGSWMNFEGRVQWLRRARVSKTEARPGWRIAADFAEACGADDPGWTDAEGVLAELAGDVPEYDGLDAAAIGMLGVPARAAAAAGA